jgi:hypothetical protein
MQMSGQCTLCRCIVVCCLDGGHVMRPAGMGKVHKNGPGTKGKFKEGQRVTAGGWYVSL